MANARKRVDLPAAEMHRQILRLVRAMRERSSP
jgi:hypothetical protein